MLLTMESKTAAHSKLEQLILRGRTKAGEVIDHVMNNQPTDRLQDGGSLASMLTKTVAYRSPIPTRMEGRYVKDCIVMPFNRWRR